MSKLDAGHLPPSPFAQWSDAILIHEFTESWVAYEEFGKDEWIDQLKVHTLHDAMVERGLDPEAALERKGYDVTE